MEPREIPQGTSKRVVWIAGLVALILSLASAQGMIMFGVDLMRLPLWTSVAVCIVLELFTIAMGLLARDAVRAQRSHQADTAAMWAAAAVSGGLAAAHQVITPGRVDIAAWTLAPALFRFALPLFAALLWHRILVADMHAMDPAVPRQLKRRRDAVRHYAACALAARRHPSEDTVRTLDEAHESMLKIVPADDPTLQAEIDAYIASFAEIDAMPGRTAPALPPTPAAAAADVPVSPATPDLAELVQGVEDASDTYYLPVGNHGWAAQPPLTAAGMPPAPPVPVDVPPVSAAVPARAAQSPASAPEVPAGEWTMSEKIDLVVRLIRTHGRLTGPEIVQLAAAEGCPIQDDRAARHLRSKAEQIIATVTPLHAAAQ